MSAAIVIPEKWEPSKLVLWSTSIARAGNENLWIIRPRRQKKAAGRNHRKRLDVQTDASRLAAAIREHAGDFHVRDITYIDGKKDVSTALRRVESSGLSITVVKLSQSELVADVQHLVKALQIRLLIVPRHRDVRIDKDDFAAERQLLLNAPCETLQLCPGKNEGDQYNSILVGTNGGKHALPALNIGAQLAASKAKKVTAVYVDQRAASLRRTDGQKIVKRAVRKSLKKHNEIVTPVVIADEDVPRGISAYASTTGHDLVIVGGGDSAMDDRSGTSISEKLLHEMSEPTVVVVRNAISLRGRIWKFVERIKRYCIPQLDREGRVDLVQRLQLAANWDFDFVFLICLATLIAALGLCVNSPPVVIGAMLVAPLMTPMLGVGLSVVQGNKRMATHCLSTIRRGFFASFLTGCAVGLIRICFTSGMTNEMSSRGSPGILDLLVAFVSGAVAAYAFGRPHLLSVLPGISIATSLVPPVATVGLCLFAREFNTALGAALLFLSNFVAIVLGSASSLWFVGMRGRRESWPYTSWSQRCVLAFFGATVCLALFFTVRDKLSGDDAVAVAARAKPDSATPTAMAEQDEVAERAEHAGSRHVKQGENNKHLPPDSAQRDSSRSPTPAQPESDQELHLVLKPRVVDAGEPRIADVSLVVPNTTEPVELTGIVAEMSNDGWVILDSRSPQPWKDVLRRFAQKFGLDSFDLCELLELELEQEMNSDFAAPM